ncbi:MAG TPA: hypothetical protein VFF43_09070, partial [Caldimonas sp.]|nr:hypothetical protein [Caldimonas sp.]
EGEERRYTKRFLETAGGDFRPWTEREWRILDRLGARGDAAVARVVRFLPADDTGMARLQTRDAGPTVDQWATLVPLRRTAPVLPYVFGDCANWWALARQCLIAFEPLHALGFVHLDFKADNVCVPWKPAQAVRPVAGQPMTPDFDGLALIDVAYSVLPGVDLPGALPLAREAGFEYQSPRLLEALDEGRRGELRPTLELDWRCDFFSLAAMLWRMLPEIDDAAGTGWTRERHDAATAFVRQLLEIHGAPLAAERPHRELIGLAALRLAEPQLAAALQAGSSFDPERAWPNGAEATPLTRVVATPVARRGERIEPRFAMPIPEAAATAPAARVDARTTAPLATAVAAPPVVEDEVAPIGAQVDLPLEIDVAPDVAFDRPREAPLADAIDIPLDPAEQRTIDLGVEAAVARATDVPFAQTIDLSAADRSDAPLSEPVASAVPSALAAAVAGAAPAMAPPRAAAVEARAPMKLVASATTEAEPTWRTLPEPPSWTAPPPLLDGDEARPAAPSGGAPLDATAERDHAAERSQVRPHLPSSSPIPKVAAVTAIVVAIAAWWQLDGRTRFEPGVQSAAAPASESVAAFPVSPENAPFASDATTVTDSATPMAAPATPMVAPTAPTAEPATTTTAAAEATAASAATTTASAPAAAAPSAAPPTESERSNAAASSAASDALEASAATWMRDRVPGLAKVAERRLAPVLAAAARSPELRRRTEIRSAAQAARVTVAMPSGVAVDAGEAQRLDEAAQAVARRDHDVA